MRSLAARARGERDREYVARRVRFIVIAPPRSVASRRDTMTIVCESACAPMLFAPRCQGLMRRRMRGPTVGAMLFLRPTRRSPDRPRARRMCCVEHHAIPISGSGGRIGDAWEVFFAVAKKVGRRMVSTRFWDMEADPESTKTVRRRVVAPISTNQLTAPTDDHPPTIPDHGAAQIWLGGERMVVGPAMNRPVRRRRIRASFATLEATGSSRRRSARVPAPADRRTARPRIH